MAITGPGTIDDLIADAATAGFPVKARLINDWIAEGLLGYPARRPAGRGHGSAPALHSESQRLLFISLLEKKAEAPGVLHVHSLARIPIFLWLYAGTDYVPTSHALRALRAWIGADHRSSLKPAQTAASQILALVDNPAATNTARRALKTYLATAVAYQGMLDPDLLRILIREVFEPSHQNVVRAAGHPSAPLTTDAVLDIFQARLAAAVRLTTGQLTEDDLERGRQIHLKSLTSYRAELPQLRTQTPADLHTLYETPTAQALSESCGNDILLTVGLHLRNPE